MKNIVITGALGFIGSNVVAKLASKNTVIVDLPDVPKLNISGLDYGEFVPAFELTKWIDVNAKSVQAIIHLGAISDTTADWQVCKQFNLDYSCALWKACARNGLRLIYASSASTYGKATSEFDDDAPLSSLHPLNDYARSKHEFDLWASNQAEIPNGWAGLKFFNVYGPRETLKGCMASVAYHAYQQLKTGRAKLFKADPKPARDFIYVQDCVDAILHFIQVPVQRINSVFNVGTGTARTFEAIVNAMSSKAIEYVEMPNTLKKKYQYFTKAKTAKLRRSGFIAPFHTIEEGIYKYVSWLRI